MGAGPLRRPLLATRLRRGISWLAVSGLPVTPVSRRGPRVLIREDMSGPDFFGGGLMGGGGGLVTGCLGGITVFLLLLFLLGSLWSQQNVPFLHLVGTGTMMEGAEQRLFIVDGRQMPGQLMI